jgi:hypothetical protein
MLQVVDLKTDEDQDGRPGIARPTGKLIARVLAGAWRSTPPVLEVSKQELMEATPALSMSAEAGLAWWKLAQSSLRTCTAAWRVKQTYRQYSLRSALDEVKIKRVFNLLRSVDIQPILVKGWAAARLYPQEGLRPYGDIDLVVNAEQYSAAISTLKSDGLSDHTVDVHRGFEKLDDLSFAELYERSRLLKLDDVDVRVLGLEDQLRILCVHMLRHGAWRPLWVCDVGAAVESRPADFDWTSCLGRNRRRADWVACAIGLAHQLLGADVEDTPVASRAKCLPSWFIPSVLKQWGAHYRHRVHMQIYFRDPIGALKELRYHWPNPIEATINVRGPLNELPRLPFQIGDSLLRTASFLTELPHLLRRQR